MCKINVFFSWDFSFQLFQTLGALPSFSLQLRSVSPSGRKEGFCDGLGLEIDGA